MGFLFLYSGMISLSLELDIPSENQTCTSWSAI